MAGVTKWGVRGVLAGNRVSILPDGVLHIRDVRNEDQMSMYTCTTRNVLTDDEKSSGCLLYTSPSPRDDNRSRMPSSA